MKIVGRKVFMISEERNTRLEGLIHLVQGRRVLHIGCCDHMHLICMKRRSEKWLRDRLLVKSACCADIDINKVSVDYVRSRGIPSVHYADIALGLPDELRDEIFDVLGLGDGVEHVVTLPQIFDEASIVFNGGYTDWTGNPQSIYSFKDIRFVE